MMFCTFGRRFIHLILENYPFQDGFLGHTLLRTSKARKTVLRVAIKFNKGLKENITKLGWISGKIRLLIS